MKSAAYMLLVSILFLNSCSLFHSKKETPEEKISMARQVAENGYETTVYFDVSSYSLNFKTEDILKRVARLQHLSKTEVYLRGHADRTGRKEFNIILSENRVESVKKYLEKLGLKDEFIHTSYYGDAEPAALGETPDIFAKNRRVEISLRPVGKTAAAEIHKDSEAEPFGDNETDIAENESQTLSEEQTARDREGKQSQETVFSEVSDDTRGEPYSTAGSENSNKNALTIEDEEKADILTTGLPDNAQNEEQSVPDGTDK